MRCPPPYRVSASSAPTRAVRSSAGTASDGWPSAGGPRRHRAHPLCARRRLALRTNGRGDRTRSGHARSVGGVRDRRDRRALRVAIGRREGWVLPAAQRRKSARDGGLRERGRVPPHLDPVLREHRPHPVERVRLHGPPIPRDCRRLEHRTQLVAGKFGGGVPRWSLRSPIGASVARGAGGTFRSRTTASITTVRRWVGRRTIFRPCR